MWWESSLGLGKQIFLCHTPLLTPSAYVSLRAWCGWRSFLIQPPPPPGSFPPPPGSLPPPPGSLPPPPGSLPPPPYFKLSNWKYSHSHCWYIVLFACLPLSRKKVSFLRAGVLFLITVTVSVPRLEPSSESIPITVCTEGGSGQLLIIPRWTCSSLLLCPHPLRPPGSFSLDPINITLFTI